MIGNAIKFLTVSEIIGWVVFLAVVLVVGASGLHAGGTTAQVVMYILAAALFLAPISS
jgi:hypothetical protein